MTTRQESFAIQGMYCARCAVNIGRALTQLDGLLSAYVNYATERATVTFDPARIGLAHIVDAASGAEYSVPLDNITWYVSDLLYATSEATVQKVLGRCAGVVRVSTNLSSARITLQGFAGRIDRDEIESRLRHLGLGAGQISRRTVALEFAVRMLVAIFVTFILGWGALNSLGLSANVRETPAAYLLVLLALFGIFGAGWPTTGARGLLSGRVSLTTARGLRCFQHCYSSAVRHSSCFQGHDRGWLAGVERLDGRRRVECGATFCWSRHVTLASASHPKRGVG